MWETCKRETRGLCFVVSFFAVANCASSVALACPEQVNKYECCINCLLTYFMFSWVHEGTSLWHFFFLYLFIFPNHDLTEQLTFKFFYSRFCRSMVRWAPNACQSLGCRPTSNDCFVLLLRFVTCQSIKISKSDQIWNAVIWLWNRRLKNVWYIRNRVSLLNRKTESMHS